MSSGQYSREEIERGIAKIYQVVLSTKNITARYIAIIALASLWVDAYDFAAFSFAIAAFKATFPWMSTYLFGLAVAAVQIGATIGAVVGGWLTDRISRRNMIQLQASPTSSNISKNNKGYFGQTYGNFSGILCT